MTGQGEGGRVNLGALREGAAGTCGGLTLLNTASPQELLDCTHPKAEREGGGGSSYVDSRWKTPLPLLPAVVLP